MDALEYADSDVLMTEKIQTEAIVVVVVDELARIGPAEGR